MKKNPLNYQGWKFKLFDQIFPLFPSKISKFIDLFGWSGEVGLNYPSNKLIYNEKSNWVFEVLQEMKANKNFIEEVDQYIAKYNLSKTNKEWYLQARQDYNNDLVKDPVLLYVLICHSFNNQIGFNKKQEFNVPFWLNRSSFNDKMRSNLEGYIQEIQKRDIEFCNFDFSEFDISLLSKDDFVYIDPPYLITVWGYERDFFCKWNAERERELYRFCDMLHKNDIKFAVSNVFDHKWKSNDILKDWSKNYNVHLLETDYANCNYQTKNRDKQSSQEVLITNYYL